MTLPKAPQLLSKAKKGDALAYVTSGGFWHPTTAVKVFVKKKNPTSVVFDLNGEEQRAGLDGRCNNSHSGRVEVWDDTKQAEREANFAHFHAKRRLDAIRQGVSVLPVSLTPEDALRETALFAELEALRASFVTQTTDLCARIAASREST